MCYSALVENDLKKLKMMFDAELDEASWETFNSRSKIDPKQFRPLGERIFPDSSYAPVVVSEGNKRVIKPMRYGIYLSHIALRMMEGFVKGKPTNYNTRRNKLDSVYWENAIDNRGFIIISGFYEWVQVRDLLRAGIVTMSEVTDWFNEKAEARKAKILEAGKKYKPTPTELKDPAFKQIEIVFTTESEQLLLVPVIYSYTIVEDGKYDYGFSIVTDEPLAEVRSAGHDRSPLFLPKDDIYQWITPGIRTLTDMNTILDGSQKIVFDHKLSQAA